MQSCGYAWPAVTVILYEVSYKQKLIGQHSELVNNVLLVKSIGFPFSPVNHLKAREQRKINSDSN